MSQTTKKTGKADLDVWQLGAKVARMDAEIGEIWKIVDRLTGEKNSKVKDLKRTGNLFEQPIVDEGPRVESVRDLKDSGLGITADDSRHFSARDVVDSCIRGHVGKKA